MIMSVKRGMCVLCVTLLAGFTVCADALAPNDATVNSNLKLWLRDAVNNYDAGIGKWYDISDNVADANSVGHIEANGVTFIAPTLSAMRGTGAVDHNISIARFDGKLDEMIIARNGMNDGVGMTDLTLFTVYQVDNASGNFTSLQDCRIDGVGSAAAEGATDSFLTGDHFNLAIDPSIRKDNGHIGGGQYSMTHPMKSVIIRVSRMDSVSGQVAEWFDVNGTLTKVIERDAAFTTSSDNFYLGDIRVGATVIRGSWTQMDFGIAEVAVYNSALDDTQIESVVEWLRSNAGLPFNSVVSVEETDGDTRVSEWTTDIVDSFSVVLNSAPAQDVTVVVSAGSENVESGDFRNNANDLSLNNLGGGVDLELTFTSENWNTPQSVQVAAVDDLDEERTHEAVLSIRTSSADEAFNNGGGMVIPVSIADNDAADLIINESDGLTEVGEGSVAGHPESDSFELSLAFEPTADVVVTFAEPDADANDISMSTPVIRFTPSDYFTPQAVTVTAVDDDLVETEIETQILQFIMTSSDANFNGLTVEMTIDVLDNECGSVGYYSMDFNQDCIVNLVDFLQFASQFMMCTYPNDPLCD